MLGPQRGRIHGRTVPRPDQQYKLLFPDKPLGHQTRPSRLASVFAGFDVEATARARSYFTGRLPSSPSIGILQGGKLVYMLERHQIENRSAEQIADELTSVFDRLCGAPVSA